MTGFKFDCADPEQSAETLRSDVQPIEPLLKWFEYSHLPPHLQAVSKPFHDLANEIVIQIKRGPERTVALRKLLESKDAAVRAVVVPFG